MDDCMVKEKEAMDLCACTGNTLQQTQACVKKTCYRRVGSGQRLWHHFYNKKGLLIQLPTYAQYFWKETSRLFTVVT